MDYRGFTVGLKASILASSCCSLPLILALAFSAAGAGSVTAALAIPKYKLFFVAAGTVFLVVSLYLNIRRRCNGVCDVNAIKSQKVLALTSIISYATFTILAIYVILPALSEWLFS